MTKTHDTIKKDWTPSDFINVKKAILKHFKGRTIETHHGDRFINNYTTFDSVAGLAYTSSGMYAVYGVCNTAIYFDVEHKYKYEFFVVTDAGDVLSELWDDQENEIFIKIG
jgi:hypothetical protein